ncbi:DUF2911 domain-containing protein [Pseudochryseolinea flava]|uniref:DUF2911 domain-containing protein n=1 Tax=Pseudochryseolinea flava TaxID=2059302 RepID=A0A364Y5F0_9BACT|nr:DUF2911 domain-containing protein [Pseudochryseolinea flava]RAW01047.1 DUF2911 domain-containing protein [Pseudochryseolinea flava]
MKKILFLPVMLLFVVVGALAQEKKLSPPAKVEGKVDNVTIKIDYYQPSARGRQIMGGLVPYGEVWRTGANNSTSVEFSGPVKIEGKDLPKGKYALFTIPNENEWVIIFNKTLAWGAYQYKQEEDVLRVTVKPTKTANFVETFTISLDGSNVKLEWENTAVSFKVKG